MRVPSGCAAPVFGDRHSGSVGDHTMHDARCGSVERAGDEIVDLWIAGVTGGDADGGRGVGVDGTQGVGERAAGGGTMIAFHHPTAIVCNDCVERMIAHVDADNHEEIVTSPGQSTCRCSLRPASGSMALSASNALRKTA